MKRSDTNIYKFARLSAGMTQETAAERIGVSLRSLTAYENFERVPRDLIVHRMIETYETIYLAYMHLKMNSDLGRYLPDVCVTDLPRGVLRLQKEIRDLLDINDKMVDVALDGCISDDDHDVWKLIEKEIDDVAAAALALLFIGDER